MRRRELLVAAAVLVPFAALVAAGFAFTAPEVPGAGEHRVNALPAPPPEVPRAPTPPQAPRTPEPVDAGPQPAPYPPELAAPLAAVEREVRRCFEDQHLRVRYAVRVHFTPTRDGGFAQVRADEANNPYLAACLEDVFAEVRWSPTGAETWAPAEHSFAFDPARD